MAHSKGPWKVTELGTAIIDSYGYQICTVCDDNVVANAEFIVRAVNTHDDLLAICEALLYLAEGKSELVYNGEIIAQARTTIARANGETD